MTTPQKRVVKESIKCKLVDELINLFFASGYIFFGGGVRDYIISKKKLYPTDFDIGVNNVKNAKENLITSLKFTFKIEDEDIIKNNKIVHSKLKLTYKHKESLVLHIDISYKKVVGSNQDFDVNGLYMTNHKTFHLVDSLSSHNLADIIIQITKKKFKVLKTYKKPEKSRMQIGVANSSKKLIEYLKIMERVSKMFGRGWKLNKQKLDEIFEPCLIKKINIDETEEKNCAICTTEFKTYELELYCCKNIMCFTCAIGHVKERFNNSEIACPYCRGDPFGWETNGYSRENDAVEEEEIEEPEEVELEEPEEVEQPRVRRPRRHRAIEVVEYDDDEVFSVIGEVD